MNDTTNRTPVHLWIVGILAVLWNAIGAFDYLATQLRLESYMSQFTAEQLDYFYSFPAWVDGAWAVAVWGALLASFGLLLRKAWAVELFGLSIVGMLVSAFYNFVLTDGAAVMGEGAFAFTFVIWAIAFGLLFYSWWLVRRGVLTGGAGRLGKRV